MSTMTSSLKSVVVSFTLLHAGILLQAAPIPAERGVADPAGQTVWYDARLLAIEGKGWTNTESFYDRLPTNAATGVFTNHYGVWYMSHFSAGICVRFATDAAIIKVRWKVLYENSLSMPHMPSTGASGVDLYGRDVTGKWRFVRNAAPKGQVTTASFELTPAGDYMLYLPLYNGVKSLEIGIPTNTTLSLPTPAQREQRKPMVVYGTSITQGGCASRPGLAAPAIVGRALDVPVINLGFSANGKMEPEMATLLAELDPSIYVIDCLWNTSIHELKARAEPFVRILRQAHPDTPILLVEDSSFRNITPTDKGRFLREVHEKLTKEGMKDLYFLSNKDMLGDDFEGTVDGCHLNDLGMMRQATVLIKALAPILASEQRQADDK